MVPDSQQIDPPKARKRHPQERVESTKRKLLDAAAKLFTACDFNGVTVRDIEVTADVQRNLVRYHFGSKDELWKAAAHEIFEKFNKLKSSWQELMRDLSPRERIAYTIRSLVRFSSANPELHRLMIQEGKQDSWRLRWILDNHIRRDALELREILGQNVGMSDTDFVHWYYMFAGGIPVMFSMAPEAKLLFGVDVNTDDSIARHADMMVDLLLSDSNS